MYKLTTRSKRAERQYYDVLNSREGISERLEKLMKDPRRELDAHKLKGKLEGKWSCSLGGDIRLLYEIDDVNKEIIVVAAGSHKKVYG
ncbi:type II toxin-antitoxin system mRNA interferase toxin, RelE/StbE family [Candidatus Woesearchaeota archaeon]|nr:type II toxin-antitoxin system mRNA interferase toxin, RelE/StbE family [Candidatus Woesearchaeota archaeon]